MLTRKQAQLLQFISERLSEEGVSPSFDEMKEAIGLKSKSGVHRLVMALEERGFIRRLKHRARALEVLRNPTDGPSDYAARGFPRPPVFGDPPEHDPYGRVLPLLGRIAAGTPIAALRGEPERTVSVPDEMLGGGKHFALEISGDSMNGAGIVDGDVAILRECRHAEPGAIVVALVDQEEATLKYWRPSAGRVVLEAANEAYPPQIYTPNRVAIQGRLVGLLRRY